MSGIPVEIIRHISRRNEFAVEVVHPAVIGAGKLVGIAVIFEANQRAAVATDIGKAIQFTILAAHDDRRLAGDVQDAKIAGLGKLRDMAGKNPVAINNSLEFQLIDRRIGIEPLVQRITRLLVCDELFDRTHS